MSIQLFKAKYDGLEYTRRFLGSQYNEMAYNAIVFTGDCVGVGLSVQELFWDSLMDHGSVW